MEQLWFYELPVFGRCGIKTNETHITGILLGREAVGENCGAETELSREAANQLKEYAEGKRRCFDLPLAVSGTDFQLRVWEKLRQIPWGEYRTYGQIAAMLGKPGASRAAGGAVGKNPLPILIPCHRVLGAGGALGGFRLGSDMKRRLLVLEGILLPDGKDEKF